MKRLRRRKGVNVRGVFSKVTTGLKFLVLINAMIFVFELLLKIPNVKKCFKVSNIIFFFF